MSKHNFLPVKIQDFAEEIESYSTLWNSNWSFVQERDGKRGPKNLAVVSLSFWRVELRNNTWTWYEALSDWDWDKKIEVKERKTIAEMQHKVVVKTITIMATNFRNPNLILALLSKWETWKNLSVVILKKETIELAAFSPSAVSCPSVSPLDTEWKSLLLWKNGKWKQNSIREPKKLKETKSSFEFPLLIFQHLEQNEGTFQMLKDPLSHQWQTWFHNEN